MRIRSTKPEFWRSRRIAAVDWEARFVLKGLESYVDDNGVGKDDLELIVGDLFSRDLVREPSRTLKRVEVAINTLHEAGLLHRYTADGTDLLYIAFWESIQYINRPTKGRFRRPDGTLDYGDSEIGTPLLSPQEDSSTSPEPSTRARVGTGDQGIRGTGDKTSCASADAERENEPHPGYNREQVRRRDRDRHAEFDEWYSAYPRKRGKGQAMKAYRSARKKVSAQVLLDAVASQYATLTSRGEEFCPYPATWLNGERWADEDASNVHQMPQRGEANPADRWQMPEPPADIADDPVRYQEWLAEQRKAAGR